MLAGKYPAPMALQNGLACTRIPCAIVFAEENKSRMHRSFAIFSRGRHALFHMKTGMVFAIEKYGVLKHNSHRYVPKRQKQRAAYLLTATDLHAQERSRLE